MTATRLRLIVAIAFAGTVAACGGDAPEEVESATVIPVTTVAADVGSIRGVVRATGIVTPAPGAELIVVAPETARVADMPKGEGDAVGRGDLLVRFDIPTLHADLESKRAAAPAADARVAAARANRTRAHDLFDRGVAARREAEDADRELAEANANLAAARAALASAEAISMRSEIRAPFDGIISKRTHNPGDLVEASAGDPVLRVIDPRRLEVVASVPIADVARVIVGASGRLMTEPDPVPLKVVSRPVAVDAGTAAAPVRLRFTSRSAYASGTPVQIEIDAETHQNVVLVPIAAIVHEGNETAVFVVEEDKAHRRVVTTGFSGDGHIEVRSGLKAGEQVIDHVPAGLPDGAAISEITGRGGSSFDSAQDRSGPPADRPANKKP